MSAGTNARCSPTMNLSLQSSDKTEKVTCYGKGISHDNRINYSSSRIP